MTPEGPVLHRHSYEKIAIVQSGRALWTVAGVEFGRQFEQENLE